MKVEPSRAALFALAFGDFGCYVPYSAITKALTTPAIRGDAVLWLGPSLGIRPRRPKSTF